MQALSTGHGETQSYLISSSTVTEIITGIHCMGFMVKDIIQIMILVAEYLNIRGFF